MEITKFIAKQREKALLLGDYGSYWKQLSRRIHVVRKKLNQTTPKGRKYAARDPITAEDIAANHEFIHLLLLSSERAWAQAMHMKTSHVADGTESITGSTKHHIGTRLHKASIYASHLVDLLKNQTVSKASHESILEARAYYSSLCGSINFEKQHWESALRGYSEARVIYASLAKFSKSSEKDIYLDLLNNTIDPSIRYAAYQNKISRTTSIESIAFRFFPRDSNEFLQLILRVNPEALQDPATAQKRTSSNTLENVPKTIQWRSRTVDLQDSATAQALAEVTTAESKLSSFLSSNQDATPQVKGAAYDEVLLPSQEAVDATKTAIDELLAENIPQSDRRMQSLQVTRTAVNFALVGWRVGRNRVLCGELDGALIKPEVAGRGRKGHKVDSKETPQKESTGRQLTRLKERVALYDSTLQSLSSVEELPGVAADQEFIAELESKRSYFTALRCLSMGRAHALLQSIPNALCLFSRALDLVSAVAQETLPQIIEKGQPPRLEITQNQVQLVQRLLQSMVFQHQALTELHHLERANSESKEIGQPRPLIERLDQYPQGKVDLTNLVTYPPKVEPIPVKPLFLDVAFNYIEYPGRDRKSPAESGKGRSDGQSTKEEKKETKKGWLGFGFGR